MVSKFGGILIQQEQPVSRFGGIAVNAPDIQPRAMAEPPEEVGFFKDVILGEGRITPQLEELQEIGAAAELNEFSLPAFRASFGLLTAIDDQEAKDILKEQFNDRITFTEDELGNTIANLPSGQFAINKPGLSPQDLVRTGFDIAAFLPAARAGSVLGAAAGAGATQGLLETASESVGGDIDLSNIITSSLLGGFFKGLENTVGAGYRAIKGKIPKITSETVEAGEKAGIPVLTSDILEADTFLGKQMNEIAEKIPFTGTGGVRAKQQIKRELAVNDIADRYGQFSYNAIVENLRTTKNKIKNAAGNVLNTAAKKLDNVGVIPLENTQNAIDAAEKEFSKLGVITPSGATRDLNVLIESLEEVPQMFSTLKENSTAFREIVDSVDPTARSQLTSRAKSLLIRINTAMREDMRSFAKDNLSSDEFKKWVRANEVYADQAKKLTKSRLKNVLDKGDITPESVQTLLFSQKPSEAKLLFDSLSFVGKQNARSAIIDNVITNLSKRARGLTPTTFANELKKKNVALKIFFKGEAKKEVDGLINVLNATRRAQEASVTTPTGQSLLVPGAAGFAFSGTPGSLMTTGAALTLGALNRIYQRPEIRDILIRAASIKPGSTKMQRLGSEFNQAFTVALQSLNNEIKMGQPSIEQ